MYCPQSDHEVVQHVKVVIIFIPCLYICLLTYDLFYSSYKYICCCIHPLNTSYNFFSLNGLEPVKVKTLT